MATVIALCVLALLAPPVNVAAAAWPTPAPTGSGPRGIAIDDAGNLYVANFGTVGPGTITKITPSGSSTASWAFTGNNPHSVAVDSLGFVYSTNYTPDSLTRVSPDGTSSGTAGDQYLWAPVGSSPIDITVGLDGALYTATGSNYVSRTELSGTSTPNWAPTQSNPRGIAVDQQGNIFTASSDFGNQVTKLTPAGLTAWTTSGSGSWGVAVDSGGNSFVANLTDGTVSKLLPDGTPAGSPWPRAVGLNPYGIVLDSAGNIYTADFGSNWVSKLLPNGTPAGSPWPVSVGSNPFGITIDSSGNLYVTNNGGNTVSRISGAEPAPPATPQVPTATAGEQKATVTVTSAPSARYGAPTSFAVSAVEDPSKGCVITLPAASCEVTGLTAGTPYTFVAAARLNAWETRNSGASSPVTPSAPPGPTPDPPGPTPDPPGPTPDPPGPTPRATLSVTNLRATTTRNGTVLTSRARVPAAGTITQTASTGAGTKVRTWCRTSRTVGSAGTYSLRCNLGSAGRKALRTRALRLTVATTFTIGNGSRASTDRKLTIKRKPPRPAFTG